MYFTFRHSIVLSMFLGLLASCAVPPASTDKTSTTSSNRAVKTTDAPKVVATTTILCDMVKQIAQETIHLTCLLKPGMDSHVYQPVPEDRKAIEDAKLVFYSGYGLESRLIPLIQATSKSTAKIAVAEKAIPKPLLGHEHHEVDETHKEAHDHDHATEEPNHSQNEQSAEATAPDPHVWQSAANGAKMVSVIKQELIKLVPENQDLYTKNGNLLSAELNAIHAWIRSQIATIPRSARRIVTTHDAMKYYAAAYDIPVEGALQGISTDEKPTATQVKKLVDEVANSNVPTIFAEVVVNPKLIEAVARDAKVKVADRELYSDSVGEPGTEGDTYPKMLITNTRTIVEGLNGRFVAFQPK